MAARIKSGDRVIVLAGKDAGKTGTVKSVDTDKVLVEGINLVKKTVKPDPNKGIKGGFKTIEKPIHISNLAYYIDSKKAKAKIGFKLLEDQKKVRYDKKTGEVLDV
ncbi:MAG: 50S ribosomal protein L24 [Legionellales bacterium]|nr:50S ribosomal protein L24 [Legionellales bacterium]|tara:strand:- start:1819 stop:2136 length:318 start_codon:yes stop_codon:yes gene_type:complete